MRIAYRVNVFDFNGFICYYIDMNLITLLSGENPTSTLRELADSEKLENVDPLFSEINITDYKECRHKNVLEHSFKVLENAIRLEPDGVDIILRTAALFHDVGKKRTRVIVNGKPTFHNHASVGAKLVAPMLKRQKYSSSQESQIRELINFHMRAYGFSEHKWTDKGYRKLLNEISSMEQVERLIIVFRSDLTTGKTEFRNRILSGINEFENHLFDFKVREERSRLRPAVNGDEIMKIFHLNPGPQVGEVMRFLNSDEGIVLSYDEAVSIVAEKFFNKS